MLIDNIRNCILCPSGKVEATVLKSLNLRPGINKVSAEDFKAYEEAISGYMRLGNLTTVNKDGDELRGAEQTMIGVISKTGDSELLRDWLEAKDAKGSPLYGKTIRKAIEAQLKELQVRE